jgi:perosamine synthetase
MDARQLAEIRALVGHESPRLIADFEHAFAVTAGGGQAVSFAAARMAFFAVLRALGIGAGDEVLLTGFTCSVMPNAVWRTGAAPRYADIAPHTLGTSAEDVARKITGRTRAIVLQHTFGICTDADSILTLAKSHGIPLIEDCALTLGSTLDGRHAGSWGDAAIFSTDHSKPLNTLTGGLAVMRDAALTERVRAIQATAPQLDIGHQLRIFSRLILERRWFLPATYKRGCLFAKLGGARRKFQARITGHEVPVLLDADFKPRLKTNSYPYPARLPAFLARLGLMELVNWPAASAHRQSVMARLIKAAPEELRGYFPSALFDPRRITIPLRLAYAHPKAAEIERRTRGLLDLDWIWFREPIAFAPLGPESFGYRSGECPMAEQVGRQIMNWPCNVPEVDLPALLELFKRCHENL